jgi:hypothetical protein
MWIVIDYIGKHQVDSKTTTFHSKNWGIKQKKWQKNEKEIGPKTY